MHADARIHEEREALGDDALHQVRGEQLDLGSHHSLRPSACRSIICRGVQRSDPSRPASASSPPEPARPGREAPGSSCTVLTGPSGPLVTKIGQARPRLSGRERLHEPTGDAGPAPALHRGTPGRRADGSPVGRPEGEEVPKLRPEIADVARVEAGEVAQLRGVRLREPGSDLGEPGVASDERGAGGRGGFRGAGWTGIPVNKISESESQKLLNMEETLHERLIGQHQAIVAVSKAIRRARVGLRNPNRPIASFIFAGPTGVGKTELTKALAAYMFGTEDIMVRLDMSEYMEKHTVAKLIGSPPGYVGYSEGGQLTEAVRGKPYTVVLFDEIEKAHPDVFNLLLQILDDGRLTDSKGRTIDFKNTLIILTSNVGAKIIEKESGIQSKKSNQSYFDINADFIGTTDDDNDLDDELYKRISSLVNEELKKYFRPEFLNRLDEIIVFRHLTKSDIRQIADIMIKQLQDRMKEKEIELEIKQIVKTIIVDQGYDPIYGARPLRRAVMRLLEDNLAQECLSKPLYPRTRLIVDADLYDNIEVTVDYSAVDPALRTEENKIETNEIE